MNFLIKDDDGLLKKHTDIWNKVGVSVKQKLNCEPDYKMKLLKTKILSYSHEAQRFS